jgi:hypothetical protein
VAEGTFRDSLTEGGPKNLTIRVKIGFWNVGAQVPGYGKARMEIWETLEGDPDVEHTVLEGTFSGGPNGRFVFTDEEGNRYTFVLKDGRLVLGEGQKFVVKNPDAFRGEGAGRGEKSRPEGGKSKGEPGKAPPQRNASPAGRWRWFTGETVTLYPGGGAQSDRGNRGSWHREGETVVIVWEKGKYIDRLRLEGNRLSGRNQLGDRVWGRRISR